MPAVSLVGKPREDKELVGLVYGVTKHDVDTAGAAWYRRPATLAILAAIICVALNFVFF